MRMLLIASIAALGMASAAQASHSGAKSAKLQNHKQTSRSYLGRQHRQHTSRKYFYNDYPAWAAKAFQPSQNR